MSRWTRPSSPSRSSANDRAVSPACRIARRRRAMRQAGETARSFAELLEGEDGRVHRDIVGAQLLEELGSQARRLQRAAGVIVVVEPHVVVEQEDVLEGDDVA